MPAGSHASPHSALPASAERIVETGRRLFFAQGFGAVTTDLLCSEANVSKTTLYKYFGDMSGLFAEVVRREGDHFLMAVDLVSETPEQFWGSVIAYGEHLLRLLNREEIIQLDRLLHEETRSDPVMIRGFYESAYGRCHDELCGLLSSGKAHGYITKPQDPDVLADHLLCMWEGLATVRARLGLQTRPHPDPSAWARACVEALFQTDVTPLAELL